jgi:hypothetical protein
MPEQPPFHAETGDPLERYKNPGGVKQCKPKPTLKDFADGMDQLARGVNKIGCALASLAFWLLMLVMCGGLISALSATSR